VLHAETVEARSHRHPAARPTNSVRSIPEHDGKARPDGAERAHSIGVAFELVATAGEQLRP
jgi:hypothetical protein